MENIVTIEATNISVLYRDFRGYPQPVRQRLEYQLKSYGKEVVEVSWPQQSKKISPTGEGKYIDHIFDILVSFEPATKGHEIFHAETLGQFTHSRKADVVLLLIWIPRSLKYCGA